MRTTKGLSVDRLWLLWATLLLGPVSVLAWTVLMSHWAPPGFGGHYAGRLWPLHWEGQELGWLLAAAILPWASHRHHLRQLDPCEEVRRGSAPSGGYRGAPPEVLVTNVEAMGRRLPLYLIRLAMAALFVAPIVMSIDFWGYLHIGCPCEIPVRSLEQTMLLMAACTGVLVLHAPLPSTLFPASPWTRRAL